MSFDYILTLGYVTRLIQDIIIETTRIHVLICGPFAEGTMHLLTYVHSKYQMTFFYWMLYATFLQDSIRERKVHATRHQLSNHQPTFLICNACSTYHTLKYVHYCMNWVIARWYIMCFILACHVFFGMSIIYNIDICMSWNMHACIFFLWIFLFLSLWVAFLFVNVLVNLFFHFGHDFWKNHVCSIYYINLNKFQFQYLLYIK